MNFVPFTFWAVEKQSGKPAVHTDIPLSFLYGFKNACIFKYEIFG